MFSLVSYNGYKKDIIFMFNIKFHELFINYLKNIQEIKFNILLDKHFNYVFINSTAKDILLNRFNDLKIRQFLINNKINTSYLINIICQKNNLNVFSYYITINKEELNKLIEYLRKYFISCNITNEEIKNEFQNIINIKIKDYNENIYDFNKYINLFF